jgi:hypothetical protein
MGFPDPLGGLVKERLLLVLAVIGFVVPNVFVGVYLAREGLDFGGCLSLWTASLPSAQLLVDLGIAASPVPDLRSGTGEAEAGYRA